MLNVRDYGAVGDNVTDDTLAFQAAIDAAATTNGNAISVPAGKYRLSQIRMKTKVGLLGDGWASALKSLPGCTQNMIVLDNPSVIWTRLENLLINGDKTTHTTTIDAIYYDGGTVTGDKSHRLRNLEINGWTGNSITLPQWCGETQIEGCYIVDCDGHGLSIGCSDISISSVAIGLCGLSGVLLSAPNGTNNRLTNVKSFWSGQKDATQGYGFEIHGNNNMLWGCEAQDSTSHGFYLAGCYDAVLAGCTCDSNRGDAFRLDAAHDCRIDGHVMDSGRADQTSIVAFANSPSRNYGRVSYDPDALAGVNPVSGDPTGNNVQAGWQ